MMDFQEAVELTRRTIRGTGYLNAIWIPNEEERIEAARTDPIVFDLLLHDIAHMIDAEKPLSSSIKSWLVSYLRGDNPKPSKRGAPNAPERTHRVIDLVSSLLPEMNEFRDKAAPSGTSACDAVAEALRLENLTPNSYSGVANIWQKHKQSITQKKAD